MINIHPTQYPEINTIISALVDKILEFLNQKVVGIYLFGSLSYGDFDEASSDIDLMIISAKQLDEEAINQLKKIHEDIAIKFPVWAKRIECSYTPLDMLPSTLPPGARPYYGEGIFYAAADYGNEWIINLYLLYRYSIVLYGPSFQTLREPINILDVQLACQRDLLTEWKPKLQDEEWLKNPHYQSYLVLNLCRIFNTVTNAQTLSKKKSAAWVKETYPQWKSLIEEAEHWDYSKNMQQQEKTLEFLRFVLEKIG